MKRYIYSTKDKNYEGEKVAPGLVRGIPGYDDRVYGEHKHKIYRGVAIRDFRNNWLGLADFDEFKDNMDVMLSAYDLITEEYPDYRIRFFNIGANDSISLLLTNDYKYVEMDFVSDNKRECSLTLGSERRVGSEYYAQTASNPKAIAKGVFKLIADDLKRLGANAKRKKTLADKHMKIYEEQMNPNDFSDTELTVDVSTEITEGREKYFFDSIPSNNEILNELESSLPVNDANRFLKSIIVRFMLSGTSICLYPKVKFERLRVDWKGKTTSTQFKGACRALSRRASDYFDKLEQKIISERYSSNS